MKNKNKLPKVGEMKSHDDFQFIIELENLQLTNAGGLAKRQIQKPIILLQIARHVVH